MNVEMQDSSCWTRIGFAGAAAVSPITIIKIRRPYRKVSTHNTNKGD
jgi:hypothetical protein